MNRRQILFLKELLDREDFVPLSEYSEKLQVSDKTLRRDMAEVSDWLLQAGGFIEKKSGVGVRLNVNAEDREKLINKLSFMNFFDKKAGNTAVERDSRKTDIAFNLLLYSDEYTSLSGLSYKYYTSKSSISGDLKSVEKLLKRHGLELLRDSRGTKVVGDEAFIRNALAEILSYILDFNINRAVTNEDPRIIDSFVPETLSTILDIFKERDITFVERLMRWTEKESGQSFDEQEFMDISLFLLIAIYRMKSGMFISESSPALNPTGDGLKADQNVRLHDTVTKVRRRIEEEYQMEIPGSESKNIYLRLASTRLAHLMLEEEKREERGSLLEEEKEDLFSEDFIDAFATITGIGLRSKEDFCRNIRLHIRLMLERAKANNPAVNPILEMIGSDYTGTLNVCRIICTILSQKLKLPHITLDEICFLMFYIQGEIISMEEKANVLLISDVSRSITILIKRRLIQRFPGWQITETYAEGFKDIKKESFDFAVSTVFDESIADELPYVFISPVLEDSDLKNVQELFWRVRTDADIFLRELIRTVRDLNDVGCDIKVSAESTGEHTDRIASIEALKGIEYIYIKNDEVNECIVETSEDGKSIFRIIFNMSDWDFMLFATKLLYLTDNCPTEVIEGFARYLTTEGGGNV